MSNYQFVGPHISTPDTIEKSMWNVAVALIPAALAGFIFFGSYSVYIVFGTAVFSVLLEIPFTGEKFPGDGSAFVTGMLLGLSLPPSSPFWLPAVGAFFAIVVAKQFFGGLGNNVFNPALAGRAIIRLSFAGYFSEWVAPFSTITTATPLGQRAADSSYLFFTAESWQGLWNLFIGNVPGTIGETSALAILSGALFLYYKGYIGWRIPIGYIGSAMGMSLLLGINPLFTILSGALLLGACFMATDMVTSPVTKTGRLVFAIGCGILTVLIRFYGYYDGGVTFSILAMNAVSYPLDSLLEGPHLGEVARRKKLYRKTAAISSVIIIFIVSIWASTLLTG